MIPTIAMPGFSEPVSSWSHLLAALIFLIGAWLLFRRGSGNLTRYCSLSLFSFSLVFLFSMSGVYHLLEPGLAPRHIFQRLDHAAIWVLIAGTFTPIHTLLFRGVWRWGFLIMIWAISISGLVLEVIFFESIPDWLSLSFYLSLGWLGVATGWRLTKMYGFQESKFLVYGGVFYSVGAVLDFVQWPILIPGVVGPHEIFHGFVVAGALVHWYFVYQRAGYPVIARLIVDVVERPGNDFSAVVRGEKMVVTATSMPLLKEKLRKEIYSHFPNSIRPKSILMKFSYEDFI